MVVTKEGTRTLQSNSLEGNRRPAGLAGAIFRTF